MKPRFSHHRTSSRSLHRPLAVAVLGLTLASTAALVSSPADAMPAPGAPAAPCLQSAATTVPAARRIPDTSPVTSAVRDRVARESAPARRAVAAATTSPQRSAAGPTYRVKVHIHVIHGSHKKEGKLSRKGARHKIFQVLQRAYNGGQSPQSDPMGISFRLKSISITRNDRWYHARPMSRVDRQMKARLHRGHASDLNIYVNKPSFRGGGLLLGYSRFPWQYHGKKKKLDGVTINVRSLPGGTAYGYNLGDSVVHETGHWLGLLHTFQGGNGDPHNPMCDPVNDQVLDTPAEYRPNFLCTPQYIANGYSTVCNPAEVAGGLFDPAFNFMDYSLDGCMQMFTPGQHARVAALFATYRVGR